jgi:hypothetical protein
MRCTAGVLVGCGCPVIVNVDSEAVQPEVVGDLGEPVESVGESSKQRRSSQYCPNLTSPSASCGVPRTPQHPPGTASSSSTVPPAPTSCGCRGSGTWSTGKPPTPSSTRSKHRHGHLHHARQRRGTTATSAETRVGRASPPLRPSGCGVATCRTLRTAAPKPPAVTGAARQSIPSVR